MKKVSFLKFTSYGNNFVIVDETRGQQLTEEEKSSFACHATNINFGIGADGVLFLQPCRPDIMTEINSFRGYWKTPPVYPHVDIMFRLFEPNGAESFSCGNGLLCMASYLYRTYNIASTRILTEVPTVQPRVITIGTNPQKGTNWANMGVPKRVPKEVADRSNSKLLKGEVDLVSDMNITFRAHDLHPFSDKTSLDLTGYLIYTGEPHLVIFPDSGFSIDELKNMLFVSSQNGVDIKQPHERRITFGSWLIHHIGTYLNRRCAKIFPSGINVDFVHIPDEKSTIEYRCYERGINKETLACGTGALAVSFVARHLDIIQEKQIRVWPHRSRWYDPEAHIVVEEDKDRWFLYGKPKMLLEGKFMLEKHLSDQIASVQAEKPDHDGRIQIQEEISYQPSLIYQ